MTEFWSWFGRKSLIVTDSPAVREFLKKSFGKPTGKYWKYGIEFRWQFVVPTSRVDYLMTRAKSIEEKEQLTNKGRIKNGRRRRRAIGGEHSGSAQAGSTS